AGRRLEGRLRPHQRRRAGRNADPERGTEGEVRGRERARQAGGRKSRIGVADRGTPSRPSARYKERRPPWPPLFFRRAEAATEAAGKRSETGTRRRLRNGRRVSSLRLSARFEFFSRPRSSAGCRLGACASKLEP